MPVSIARMARYGLLLGASIACIAALAACPTRTRLNASQRESLRESYRGQTYFLKQSMYHGAFYDDDTRHLADPHVFSDLKLMTSPDGDIIIPPPPQGIVPAGTPVEVLDIEFPTSAAIVRRPLFTPRYNIWLRLKVGRYAADVGLYRPGEYIVVLPTTVRDSNAVRASLGAILSNDNLDDWLAKRSDEARLAIFEKRAQTGLSYDELVAALGLPLSIHRSYEGKKKIEITRFGETEIRLEDGIVTAIHEFSDESKLEPPAAQPASSAPPTSH